MLLRRDGRRARPAPKTRISSGIVTIVKVAATVVVAPAVLDTMLVATAAPIRITANSPPGPSTIATSPAALFGRPIRSAIGNNVIALTATNPAETPMVGAGSAMICERSRRAPTETKNSPSRSPWNG